MRPYLKSLGYALCGLRDAWQSERNLRLFAVLYMLSLILGYLLGVMRWEWIALVFSGAVFLAIELLNTALEHFTDAFDSHSKAQDDVHENSVRATKDIAAAASLMCAVAWGVTVVMIYWPHMTAVMAR